MTPLNWLVEVIFPFGIFILFIIRAPKSVAGLILNILLLTSIFITFYFHINWSLYSVYLRYLLIVFAAGFAFKIVYRIFKKGLPNAFKPRKKAFFFLKLALTLFFIYESFWVIKGLQVPENTVNLEFPFKNGTYFVTSGGSSNMLNAHFERQENWYAVDIIKLNKYGRMWNNTFFLSKNLSDYPVFGDTVYAPCNGVVLEVINGRPDNSIGQQTFKSNYIRIKLSAKHEVMLAHLKNNSIIVDSGDIIKINQPLALIGNSGKAKEPHLHIHAQNIDNDDYIPILFNDNYLISNELILLK